MKLSTRSRYGLKAVVDLAPAYGGTAVPLGNVTIPANFSIPACQELVEIEYLYVVSSLVQPVYKGVRTDLPRSACTTSQLKYRADLGDDDATNDQFAELAA